MILFKQNYAALRYYCVTSNSKCVGFFLISAERTYKESCDDNLPCSRNLECKASGDKKTCQCKQDYEVFEGRCFKGRLMSLLMHIFTLILNILKSIDHVVYIHLACIFCVCILYTKFLSFACTMFFT